MATRLPPRRPSRRRPSAPGLRVRLPAWLTPPLHPWVRRGLVAVAVTAAICLVAGTYFWISVGRTIDARLSGEQQSAPRIYGRVFELRRGQGWSHAQLIQRLNDVGYAQRPSPKSPGEFGVTGTSVLVVPRDQKGAPRTIRVDFARATSSVISRLSVVGGGQVEQVTLEAPLLASLAPGERRRFVPLASIPRHVIDAVLVIEDIRFYDHPGVDPIGIARAAVTNLRGDLPYLVGGSTLTQQIVKNTFLTPAQTPTRKLREQFMALVLESRFSKDEILELYLNDVNLGQRGPFAIHGFPEAARVFFGKDIRNVTLAEAATLAGIIQSPSRLSPFRQPDRARDRRNVVLRAMVENKRAPGEAAARAAKEPLVIATRALENEAPYFVDYVTDLIDARYEGLLASNTPVEVYTTLDLHLQRLAQEALAEGLAQVDKQLAARKRTGQAQAALVAIDPRTGDILAMAGGRAYHQSQYNRAVAARRQPGSVFKPFVFLAAFEAMAEEGRADFTPATLVADEPTTFKDGETDYAPANYQDEYDGPVTLRRALARSRNIVAIKVAEAVGYDRVARLWRRADPGSTAKAYPSIALGVFEASPLEIGEAYTLFANGGTVRPLRAVLRMTDPEGERRMPVAEARKVARPDTTYLVTNMMRSVLNEGTGAGARSAGFTLDAAGKSGTTNDLRDAWFVGLTPELLTVVWVGFDNNQPIGLGGSQAALPIWTSFMRRALAGRTSVPFTAPAGIEWVAIDKVTGQRATPDCPEVIDEAFLAGTAPGDGCELHGGGISSVFSRLGGFFKRIVR